MNNRVPVSHYLIPGTSLELLDVLKLCLSPGEFQACLWFSLEQYIYRWHKKGDAVNDLEKAVNYLGWLLESVKEHGVCMGR